MIVEVIVALIIMMAAPFIVFFTNKYVEEGKRLRVFKRLLKEPTMQPGTRIACLLVPGCDKPIFENSCIIESLEIGRIGFLDGSNGNRVIFTGREVENLIIIVK